MVPDTPWKYNVVRDLSAVLGEPSIMQASATMPCIDSSSYKSMQQNAQTWLRALDQNPEPLLSHIRATPRHNRLGLYYEALVSFWLQNHSSWQLLAHELPVYEGKRTVGAYDFLVETEEGVVHIETAVKYYLGIRGAPDWHDWVGPGLNDCLALKMSKMLSKQIKLSESQAGLRALGERGISPPVAKKLWLKGMYFRPFSAAAHCGPQHGIAAAGLWLTLAEWEILNQGAVPEKIWVARTKPDWIGHLAFEDLPPDGVQNSNFPSAIKEKWDEQGQEPSMWSRLERSFGLWRETQRVFLVPDQWEARAKAINWAQRASGQV